MKCERCGKDDLCTTGSYFNTEIICPECDEAERAHPQYAEAVRVENEHVKAGNLNFEGIGLPKDLRPKSKSPAGGRS